MEDIAGELFDRRAEFEIWSHTRPHWHQTAAICFLTMRLNDSIPSDTIRRWHRERLDWLARRGIVVDDWKQGVESLAHHDQTKFRQHFNRLRETTLDECRWCCGLSHREAQTIVVESFRKFHRDRYWLGDFVIMPNHVHLLVAFASPDHAKRQPGSWMRYTARKINPILGRSGAFWFEEPFDHLVRTESQLNRLRDYIRRNPSKAGLNSEQFVYIPSAGAF